jgi:hypothetical protein
VDGYFSTDRKLASEDGAVWPIAVIDTKHGVTIGASKKTDRRRWGNPRSPAKLQFVWAGGEVESQQGT